MTCYSAPWSQVLVPGLKVIVPDLEQQHCLQFLQPVCLLDPHIPEKADHQ